jgi:hypothetical protein
MEPAHEYKKKSKISKDGILEKSLSLPYPLEV